MAGRNPQLDEFVQDGAESRHYGETGGRPRAYGRVVAAALAAGVAVCCVVSAAAAAPPTVQQVLVPIATQVAGEHVRMERQAALLARGGKDICYVVEFHPPGKDRSGGASLPFWAAKAEDCAAVEDRNAEAADELGHRAQLLGNIGLDRAAIDSITATPQYRGLTVMDKETAVRVAIERSTALANQIIRASR